MKDAAVSVVAGFALSLSSTAFAIQSLNEKNEFNNCNFKFILEFFNEEDIKNTYEKLKIKGIVLQVLEESSWGSLYAEIKDEFGITWGLNLEMGIL